MKIKFGYKNQAYNEQLAKIPHNFAVVHDEEKKVTEITIYGIIGESWWWDSTSASDVDKALKEANGNDLVIHLNSPGGDAPDGVAIYNRLMDYKREHNAKIKVCVDGWACSAASPIPLAGDESVMGLGAMMMIHEASSFVWGSKTLMRKEADILDKLEEGIIDIYMTRANKTREEIRKMVDDETWFSAQEAVDIGFATSIISSENKDDDAEIQNLRSQIVYLENEIEQLRSKNPEKPANSKAFLFY